MSDTTEPVPVGVQVRRFTERIERIMSLREKDTERLRELVTRGEVVLPCHDACDGDIVVDHDSQRLRGFCPMHMVERFCPLTEKAEKELRARLTHAGFGARYHDPDPGMIRGRETVEQFLGLLGANLTDGRGLILSGDTGVGKTMTAAYVARRMLVENHGVWKVTHEGLIEGITDRQTRKATVRRACMVECLILDDWGSAEMVPWVLGIVEGIVEARYGNRMSTIVTTNMTAEQLRQNVTMRRIVDRWRHVNTLIEVGGDSMRTGG